MYEKKSSNEVAYCPVSYWPSLLHASRPIPEAVIYIRILLAAISERRTNLSWDLRLLGKDVSKNNRIASFVVA